MTLVLVCPSPCTVKLKKRLLGCDLSPLWRWLRRALFLPSAPPHSQHRSLPLICWQLVTYEAKIGVGGYVAERREGRDQPSAEAVSPVWSHYSIQIPFLKIPFSPTFGGQAFLFGTTLVGVWGISMGSVMPLVVVCPVSCAVTLRRRP